MTLPEQPPQDRREAEIAALEAAVAAAVTASLVARLARVARGLRSSFRWATTDPTRWRAARRDAAAQLRAIRPGIGAQVGRFLPRAAQLGAAHAGGTLPAGHVPSDDLIRDTLAGVDQDVARKLEQAAAAILDGALDTEPKLAAALDRVDVAKREADAATGTAVSRAVAGGVKAVADAAGIARVWWSERDSCLHCQGLAGAVAEPGEPFRAVRQYATRPLPWVADGVDAPPLHRSCRCHTALATEGLPDALRREAERGVAQGVSAFDSLPARLRTVDRVLVSSRLPKSVRERAAHDRRRGAFTVRQQPARTASTRRG